MRFTDPKQIKAERRVVDETERGRNEIRRLTLATSLLYAPLLTPSKGERSHKTTPLCIQRSWISCYH